MTHSNEVSFEGNMNNWGLWSLLPEFWNAFTLGKQGVVAGPLAFVHGLSSRLPAWWMYFLIAGDDSTGGDSLANKGWRSAFAFSTDSCSFALLFTPSVHFSYSIYHLLMRKKVQNVSHVMIWIMFNEKNFLLNPVFVWSHSLWLPMILCHLKPR